MKVNEGENPCFIHTYVYIADIRIIESSSTFLRYPIRIEHTTPPFPPPSHSAKPHPNPVQSLLHPAPFPPFTPTPLIPNQPTLYTLYLSSSLPFLILPPPFPYLPTHYTYLSLPPFSPIFSLNPLFISNPLP